MQFPLIESERFILTEFDYCDADNLIKNCSDPSIYQFILRIPVPYTQEHAYEFIENARKNWVNQTAVNWAVRDKSDPEQNLIASLELRQDNDEDSIGIWVSANYRGMDVAREIIKCAIKWSTNNNFTKNNEIYYTCNVINSQSKRVAEKLGFKQIDIRHSKMLNREGNHFDYYVFQYKGS